MRFWRLWMTWSWREAAQLSAAQAEEQRREPSPEEVEAALEAALAPVGDMRPDIDREAYKKVQPWLLQVHSE